MAKLFVNNSTGRIGLVGYWDLVAFDEFAGKSKKANNALVDILKNYMANKSFSRGIETLGAEASMAFVGNTQHTVPYMLRHSDLFDDLPSQYHDSAFLDRLHFYLPGWEVDIIRGEMFSEGYGFVVDYLAEILRSLRNHDYSQLYHDHFELNNDLSTRDRTGIEKTFSGLMKILFPHQEATPDEIEELLQFAIEGRKRVKDQLLRIDTTYAAVNFGYRCSSGEQTPVNTLEQELYPRQYEVQEDKGLDEVTDESESAATATLEGKPNGIDSGPARGHLVFQENQRGVSFDSLLGPYLQGASRIAITDPYIRLFYQARNLMELLETIASIKADDEEVEVLLVTMHDEYNPQQQLEYFEQMKTSSTGIGIRFDWKFDESGTIHARHIQTDTGWKILLDRGLDIFQHYEMNDAFTFNNRLQQYRACKAFEVTFLKAADSSQVSSTE